MGIWCGNDNAIDADVLQLNDQTWLVLPAHTELIFRKSLIDIRMSASHKDPRNTQTTSALNGTVN